MTADEHGKESAVAGKPMQGFSPVVNKAEIGKLVLQFFRPGLVSSACRWSIQTPTTFYRSFEQIFRGGCNSIFG